MKNGFTKLEVILFGIILSILVIGIGKIQFSNRSKGNNQIPTKDTSLCTRTTPYNNPPELLRALSLGYERENPDPNAPSAPKGSYKNCIHLIYKDISEMNDAEGFFSFDPNSGPNDLRIYVVNTYKDYDDILTASLLEHELRHATFLVKVLEGTPSPNCIQNEVASFYSQLVFLTNLNEEEWKSLTYRVAQNPNLNSAYQITDYLLRLNKNANDNCPQDPDQSCWNTYVKNNLENWIRSNPFYQKQCELK